MAELPKVQRLSNSFYSVLQQVQLRAIRALKLHKEGNFRTNIENFRKWFFQELSNKTWNMILMSAMPTQLANTPDKLQTIYQIISSGDPNLIFGFYADIFGSSNWSSQAAFSFTRLIMAVREEEIDNSLPITDTINPVRQLDPVPELVERFAERFYADLTISASAFISPELQEKLKNAKLLIAGAGSIGNPIANAAVRAGALNITIADPDEVEVSNLARQEYEIWQVHKNKAQMTALSLRLINPTASKTIRSIKEGITIDNVADLVEHSDFVIDGIDIRSLDMIWELHKQAVLNRKPVIVGYDLAGTAMLCIYRYDKEDMLPLKGELTEEKVQEFKKVKAAFETGKIQESQFLNYIYDTFTGPINPLHVPVEQLNEILERDAQDTRSYQLGSTSRTVSALTIETILKLLNGEEVKDEVYIDLPSAVRATSPGIFYKLSLICRVLPVIKKRSKDIKALLSEI